MIVIDGSGGEGGGQILRTSLALALITGTRVRIEKIRARRQPPGLLRQHLTAVNAAAAVGQAVVSGATIGSAELTFAPGRITAGDYRFSVGTAGSTTLVLQTVLPALLLADAPSTLTLEGGTHNPFAPPFDFLVRAYLPVLSRMGARVTATLERPGFYPAGGGRLAVTIEPARALKALDLSQRGAVGARRGRAIVAHLPRAIAERELALIRRKLSWREEWLQVEQWDLSPGPGNVVLVEIESEHVTEVFTGFGERGVMAEAVADCAVQAARQYLAAEVAVSEHLADQLLLPMALAGDGVFTTVPLSRHAATNAQVIGQFLPVKIKAAPMTNRSWRVEVGR